MRRKDKNNMHLISELKYMQLVIYFFDNISCFKEVFVRWFKTSEFMNGLCWGIFKLCAFVLN